MKLIIPYWNYLLAQICRNIVMKENRTSNSQSEVSKGKPRDTLSEYYMSFLGGTETTIFNTTSNKNTALPDVPSHIVLCSIVSILFQGGDPNW